MHEDIKDLVTDSINRTRDWRERVASEFPDDDRNAKAVKELEALASQLDALEADDPLLLELAGFWRNEKYAEDIQVFIAIESEVLRTIGFHQSFASAEEFLVALIKRLHTENKKLGSA